ncbi:MAG: bifunctional heptose 7-phosphate kinase/heptose 1-phosphate adenyltransferase, partial [Rhodospirillales bacterium]|nr:bifunctional heptose 7-phosphate kinase/heptose 1-phosphate adenyltransferase [Rhodospirillales bacterium]
RQRGDALIVGLNTDASVRRLKGPGRPVQNEHDRAHILAAQACVDAVVLFDEDTPLELIKTIQPDVLTKGADYKRKQDIVGWNIVEQTGGRVERIPLTKGKSTTRLIEKTKK